jgi:hypothetical protein
VCRGWKLVSAFLSPGLEEYFIDNKSQIFGGRFEPVPQKQFGWTTGRIIVSTVLVYINCWK